MTRDNIIGLVIILVLMIGFSLWMSPSDEELAERRKQQEEERIKKDTISEDETVKKDTIIPEEIVSEKDTLYEDTISSPEKDDVDKEMLSDRYGVFANSVLGDDDYYILENEIIKLKIKNKGGYISSVQLKEYETFEGKPLKLFYSEDDKFKLNFFYGNRVIATDNLYFEPYFFNDKHLINDNHIIVEQEDSVKFAMRLHVEGSTEENPKYLEFLYGISGKDYIVDFDINFIGYQDIVASNTTHVNFEWNLNMPRSEKNRDYEQSNSGIYYRYTTEEVDNLRQGRDDTEILRSNIEWVSFKQQFFSSVLITETHFSNAELRSVLFDDEDTDFLKNLSASMDMPYSPRGDNFYSMKFYFGPNHYQSLRAYDIDLERKIPLGWGIFGWINRLFIIPVFNYLEGFNINYGIIILILTIMLKIVLLPIAYKTYISSAKMRVLKPEVDELGKKFPKKEDAMKKQQAVMALYKKAGVNPMAGCIPMLLQLPILIAMFRFFPASIELRQESFLWADDLSSYDSILDLPFSIPFYGDHVSLFTLLMAVSTIIYTRMNTQMMGSTNQMPGMKTMLYMMPIMLLAIFNNFASALSYYYFLTNMITFGQMFLFRKLINEDAIYERLQQNKKKPVKKSNWQKKLEEMAKERAKQGKRKR